MPFISEDDQRRERQHAPGTDPAWQETMWFGAYDLDSGFALEVHLARQPSRGRIEVIVCAALGGEVISMGGSHKGDDLFSIPGLELCVIEPMKRFRISFSGYGNVGHDGDMIYAKNPYGETRFEFTLDMYTTLPVCNIGESYWRSYKGKPMGDSYVVVGKFRGHMRRGEEFVPISGVMERDHSWANRDWVSFDHLASVYAVLGDAEAFLCATYLPMRGTNDFAVIHDKNGTRNLGIPSFSTDFRRTVKGIPEGAVYVPDYLRKGQRRLGIKSSLVIPYWQSSFTSSHKNQLWCENVCTFEWERMSGVGMFNIGYSGDSVHLPLGLENTGDPPSLESRPHKM